MTIHERGGQSLFDGVEKQASTREPSDSLSIYRGDQGAHSWVL
jgi:hypothetical protein